MRREYLLRVEINGRLFKRVPIDPHYENKHSGSIDDRLILDLVRSLNGSESAPTKVTRDGFEIYVDDPIYIA